MKIRIARKIMHSATRVRGSTLEHVISRLRLAEVSLLILNDSICPCWKRRDYCRNKKCEIAKEFWDRRKV